MATTKVSELAALTTPDGAEELLINDGGTSKKITIANAIIAGTGITKSGATISASPVALTTVQTAANQTAHLALTAQEGDVVVRSDENKTYMHNGGSAGNMNDYTLLATPTDAVTSVGGNTGVVTNAQIAASVEAASDSNTFTDADHSKLNAIEASADVTDATNVTAAGALMDSEVTNLAEVKAFAASDYATAAQGTTANAALPKAGGTMTGDLNFGDDIDANFGASADLKILHSGSNSIIRDSGTGGLYIESSQVFMTDAAGNENMFKATENGSVELYHNNAKKLETTSTGVTVTGNIANASGTLTIDSASDIQLDADGSAIHLLDGGTHMGTIKMANSNINLDSQVVDKDIIFSGNDGGVAVTALTLDMSDGGAATFNGYADFQGNNIYLADNGKAVFGTSEDLQIYHDGSNSYVKDTGDGDLYLMGADEVLIRSATNENMIKAVANAQVNLYYDNALKLATSAAGVTVTGDLLVKSAGANASIKLTDSDNNVDGYVYATGGDVGFLDDDGNWAYRIDTDTNHKWMINDATEMLLESDGDLHVDGDVIAYSTSVSDERLKDNIKVVDSALDKVKELKGVTFTRKQDGVESAGVIAQDVEKVLPQAVKHKALPLQTGNDELFKTVQYDALHALLIEAVKELSEKVEKLENK